LCGEEEEHARKTKKPPGPSGRRRLGEHLCGALALTKEKLLGRAEEMHSQDMIAAENGMRQGYRDLLTRPPGVSVFKRLLRVTIKLGLIAAIGFGVAVVVRKLTAPADSPAGLEPWPPLQADERTNGADGDAAP
jgi:hypothetical protein